MILVYCFLLLTLQLLQRTSGFWHSLFSPSGSDALWLKLAAPWQRRKTNEPSSPYQLWEPFQDRFWKGVHWKRVPSGNWHSEPSSQHVCLPFTQGSCSTRQIVQSRWASLRNMPAFRYDETLLTGAPSSQRGYDAHNPISGSVNHRTEIEGHSCFKNLPSYRALLMVSRI